MDEKEQIDVASVIGLLEQCGPNLKFPFSSGIEGTKLTHLRELRHLKILEQEKIHG